MDIRWSYDPRTDELDIWDSNNGRIGHFERHGIDGYSHCAQGRLNELHDMKNRKKILHSISASIYSDRPFAFGEEEEKKAEEIRNKAKIALNSHYEPYPVHWQLTL